MKITINAFRKMLKRKIIETKTTQLQLSRQSGVSQPCLSKFLSGKSGLSSQALLSLFDFVLQDIAEGDETEPKQN